MGRERRDVQALPARIVGLDISDAPQPGAEGRRLTVETR